MTADNDIVERLRALSRCEHSDLSVGDEAAAEIVRLRGEVAALLEDPDEAELVYRCGDPDSDAIAPAEAKGPAPAMPNGVGGLAYAQRLAVAIWSRNYREVSPQWEVCEGLMGVLSQIDNMVSGMSATDNRDAAGVCVPSAETIASALWRDWMTNDQADALGREMHKWLTAHAQTPTAAPAGEAVAYLDIGVGGYLDLGTEKDDDELFKLPPGRHMLGIIGTHGVDGYKAHQPAGGEAVALTDERIEAALDTPMGLDHTLRKLVRGDTMPVGYSKVDVVRALLVALGYTTPPAALTKGGEAVARDREADRARFADAAFNNWLDEGISDSGHTIWDAVGDVSTAWSGWCAREFYATPPAAQVQQVADYEATYATTERLAKPAATEKCDFCGVRPGELHAFDCTALDGHPAADAPEVVKLVRYGRGPAGSPYLLDQRDDGYWTPWHIAQRELTIATLAAQELARAKVASADALGAVRETCPPWGTPQACDFLLARALKAESALAQAPAVRGDAQ